MIMSQDEKLLSQNSGTFVLFSVVYYIHLVCFAFLKRRNLLACCYHSKELLLMTVCYIDTYETPGFLQ